MTADPKILESTLVEGVLTLTLNRPDRRNALHPPLMRALVDALADAQDDARVRCVLLRGAGKDFCVGGDVAAAKDANDAREPSPEEQAAAAEKAAKRGPITPEQLTAWLRRSADSARLLHQMPKVTVAALHGNVVGAGLGLALACDFRIVADSTKFTAGFLKVGYSGDFGGAWFLQNLVGAAKARELYLLNETIDAGTAERLGLSTRRVADDQLDAAATEFAAKIAKGPPIAMRYMKANFLSARTTPLDQYLDLETRNQNRTGMTQDSKEALKALFEKRAPIFKGE
ncbi:MAG TPA: enoyl-CoA hydratase-related protein [Nevskiaceae bacterium]|nr:enoyl-CoA hydratase-related protein [Nevskiaceae bacterium]